MKNKRGFVYILGNKKPTLYIGVTSDLTKRAWEHKNDFVDGFSKKYKTHKLLYCEIFDDIEEAIRREKQLKNWRREWKLALIKTQNPNFEDLYEEIKKS